MAEGYNDMREKINDKTSALISYRHNVKSSINRSSLVSEDKSCVTHHQVVFSAIVFPSLSTKHV